MTDKKLFHDQHPVIPVMPPQTVAAGMVRGPYLRSDGKWYAKYDDQTEKPISSGPLETTSIVPKVSLDLTTYVDAQASSAANCAGVLELSGGEMIASGLVKFTGHGLTQKTHYYLDQTTAGAMTDTEPATGIIQRLFYVVDVDHIAVNVQEGWEKSNATPPASLIDDTNVSASTTWSSQKIDEILSVLPIPVGSDTLVPQNWYEVPNGSASSTYPLGWRSINGALNENEIITGVGPSGDDALLWRTTTNTTTGVNGGADGGVNGNFFDVDPTKTYRTVVFVRKNVNLTDGSLYSGLYGAAGGVQNGSIVDHSNGAVNNNPYYWYGDLPTIGEWYAVVGYLHPHTSANSPTVTSKVYKVGDPSVTLNGVRDFRFASASVDQIRMRFYLFYSLVAGTQADFAFPRVEDVEHALPLEDLMRWSGQVLNSPNGNKWLLGVNDLGAAVTYPL